MTRTSPAPDRLDELAALRDSARAVLEKESNSARVRSVIEAPDGFDRALWSTMAELGWTAMLVPERHGGSGGSFTDLTVLLEELGRHVTPAPFFATAVLTVSALLLAGDDEQQSRWLPKLADGTTVGTFVSCGVEGRYDDRRLAIEVGGDGRDLVLDGTAAFVPDASAADLFVVAAGDHRGDHGGVTLAVVDASAPGLTAEATPTVDRTRRLGQVVFDGVRVDASAVLGSRGAGGDALEALIDRAAVALAADCLGGADRMLEMSVDYARSRKQFGRPIGSFQAIKHLCADMFVLVEASRVAVDHAAAVLDDDGGASVPASIAKSCAADAYAKVAGDGVQVHGGIGFTWEHDAHLYLKRAKLDQAWFGDSAWHRERVAQRVFPSA